MFWSLFTNSIFGSDFVRLALAGLETAGAQESVSTAMQSFHDASLAFVVLISCLFIVGAIGAVFSFLMPWPSLRELRATTQQGSDE